MSVIPDNSIIIGKDISFHPWLLKTPTAASPRTLVIGGGVTGLTIAWVLLDRGYHVTIVAKEWASYMKDQRLTSQIAGALWEFPPAVCGQHTDESSIRSSKRWSMLSYSIWEAISAIPGLVSGVQMRTSAFFFSRPMKDDQEQLSKMLEIRKSGVRGFRHSPDIALEYNVGPEYGVVDAYQHLAPVVDTDQAISWLKEFVEKKGAECVTQTIRGDLLGCEDELREKFCADVIVNATGLGGYELAVDSSCYPICGAIIRVINDGKNFLKIATSMCISADAALDYFTGFVFILLRNERILLLGGISEPHEDAVDLMLNLPIIKKMCKQCEAFLPALKNARVDDEYPLVQGLRPFRLGSVRVERELRPRKVQSNGQAHLQQYVAISTTSFSRIIYSYGQGGAGWSLAFGCAGDIACLVDQTLLGLPPKAMEDILLTREYYIQVEEDSQMSC
ncbi:hypothetical protein OIDMADRAFT_139021 [Oidiodendron maius Zn]|uniref:FAD dependent oxidoreductase domain-containing protein n=1 Tax=Oidiodendron maius (strain Zn) TaxID=913774 RepID=A0A0C3GMI9_OIDMZ|nr:hypothetical protein OIDMADRAFT_139021 [Oidiodendron maius Zn]